MTQSKAVGITVLAFSITFFGHLAQSQKLPSGAEVLQKVVDGVEGVQDYEVSLEADVHLERVRIPRAKATMYFKKPDKVHFDSPSIAMMPREGIAFNSAAVLEQYTAEMVGGDTVQGKKAFKLQLAAKAPTARLRQLFIWINPENWTISRLQTIPHEGRILTMDFSYGFQDGKYWMPVSLTASFGILDEGGMKKPQVDSSSSPETPLDQMQMRAPRSGSISITYSDYKINIGLSDEIFKPTQNEQ
jgi:outer membrane lipoprotein-sorting protein